MYIQKEVFESHFYISVKERNKRLIVQILKNNAYLLRQINKTLAEQIRDIGATGVKLSRNYIRKLRYGEKTSCNLSYLNFFAEYWNLPILELGAIDYEERGYTSSQLLQPDMLALWKSPKTKAVKTLNGKVVYKYV